MNAVKGVIFDMDGLMIDSERIIHNAIVRGGTEMGLDNIEEVSMRFIGGSNQAARQMFYDAYGENADFDMLMDLKHKYIDLEIGDKGFPAKKGIHEIVDLLLRKGYRISVGSSTREWAVKEFLGKINVLDRFDIFVCGDMGLRSKPFPDIFLACAEKMGAEPSDCFVLEDSINGIKAAYAAGMNPVMIPDLAEPTDEIMPMLYSLKPSLIEAAELF